MKTFLVSLPNVDEINKLYIVSLEEDFVKDWGVSAAVNMALYGTPHHRPDLTITEIKTHKNVVFCPDGHESQGTISEAIYIETTATAKVGPKR